MRTIIHLAIPLSLLSTVAFSASSAVGESPMSPLGIRTVIPGDKAMQQLPLYLEPPSTNEVIKCVKKQGGCLAIIPTSNGAIIRKYAKPKFSKTQFVFEDNPLSSDSRAEDAWQSYQALRDMLLTEKCLEIDYGAEISEVVGDKYRTLTNDVATLARTYDGKSFDRSRYEADFDAILEAVQKKSVAGRGRRSLRAVNDFRVAHAQEYSLPDSESKAILSALDEIRKHGVRDAPEAVQSLVLKRNAYANAVLAHIRKERETRIAALTESQVPFVMLFDSQEFSSNPLMGFPSNVDRNAEAALAVIDKRIAAAEEELAEGRKRYTSVIGRMAELDKSKFGQGMVYGTGNREQVVAIIGRHSEAERYLTAEESLDVETILIQAEMKQKELTSLEAEVLAWAKETEQFCVEIQKIAVDASGYLQAQGVSSEIASGFGNLNLFNNGEDQRIMEAVAKAKHDPIGFGHEGMTKADNLLKMPKERLKHSIEVLEWAKMANGKLQELIKSGFDLNIVFANDEHKKIQDFIRSALHDPLNFGQTEKEEVNDLFRGSCERVATGRNSRQWCESTMKEFGEITMQIKVIGEETDNRLKALGLFGNSQFEQLAEAAFNKFSTGFKAAQETFYSNLSAQFDNPLTILTKERREAENAVKSARLSLNNLQITIGNAIDEIRKESAEYYTINSNDKIEFFGFYPGMPEEKFLDMEKKHGLDKSLSFDAYLAGQIIGIGHKVSPETKLVYWIEFEPDTIRYLSGRGDTVNEIIECVKNRINGMEFNEDTFQYEKSDSEGGTATMNTLGHLWLEDRSIADKVEKSKVAAEARGLAETEECAPLAIKKLGDSMVQIPGKKYFMCKYEVTQALWFAVMGYSPSCFKGANLPVENISWEDIQLFLLKLNDFPDIKATGYKYRLPTEEEWEYACRAGAEDNWLGDAYCRLADGATISRATVGEVAWYADNSDGKAHPVGKKKPNAFGLYDMIGNVHEYTSSPGRYGSRVLLGGNYDDSITFLSLADSRLEKSPVKTIDFNQSRYGFRLAADKVDW